MKGRFLHIIWIISIPLWIGAWSMNSSEAVQNQDENEWEIYPSQTSQLPQDQERSTELPKIIPENPADFEIDLPELEEFQSVTSDTLFIILPPGGSFTETMTCSIPDLPPVADILIAFDLTGSMADELDSLKSNSVKIMNALREKILDSRFGVISGEDYPRFYNSCGYGGNYGSQFYGDLPFRKEISLTQNTNNVANTINTMFVRNGADTPECYANQFYETVAELKGDTNSTYGTLDWRQGAKKIVLAFNDNIPHDCNWRACLGGFSSTGVDPGRDGIIGTPDDLSFMDVLDLLSQENITLVDVFSGIPGFKPYWDCWTQLTPGGGAFQIYPDGTIPGGVSIDSFIVDIIESSFDTVNTVTVKVCSGDTTYFNLSSVTPPSYHDVLTPAVLPFDLDLHVTAGTPPGEYCLDVCSIADGAEICRLTVCVTVIGSEEMTLDIKPQSCPNPLNPKSKGVLPVSIRRSEPDSEQYRGCCHAF
jgi:hypothetical protein